MTKKIYLVAGHGAGDPGAVGNGYQEADLARKIANSLYAKLKNHIDIVLYDTSKNLYKTRDYGSFNKNSYVVEIHLNSAAVTATGTEILIKQGYSPDASDKALLAAMAKYFTDRGVKYRNDLANMNNFAALGIGYVLVEVCFINNMKDVNTLINKYDSIINDLAKALGGSAVGNVDTSEHDVPAANQKITTHTVVKGETLYAIAKKYNLTLASLIGLNPEIKDANIISVGQKIKVHTADASAGASNNSNSGSNANTSADKTGAYQVKITASVLNVRKGPGTSYAIATTVKKGGVYTIISEKNGWGELKSGAGWISLEYAAKI